ncbi:hypothetical protein PUW25_26200 (plasmid) [Paenibacillus urinalis]|uniref:Uncharacterized protein n=1 Tax=Paenibacillus urinalis TaxID=521520 RepID=A0ABY7XH71_9BACL|nr:hypothetical protein [Paenibacillus urinalis]WDI05064.1 hypothetical protein PUW25_26200 [Paenibacillus urinalis]
MELFRPYLKSHVYDYMGIRNMVFEIANETFIDMQYLMLTPENLQIMGKEISKRARERLYGLMDDKLYFDVMVVLGQNNSANIIWDVRDWEGNVVEVERLIL